jgi:hypothetical protein
MLYEDFVYVLEKKKRQIAVDFSKTWKNIKRYEKSYSNYDVILWKYECKNSNDEQTSLIPPSTVLAGL